MVKSSIVVPSQTTIAASRKRSIDQDKDESASTPAEEPKRPRLALNADGKKRGQRLFGVLLGTLNKFKDDSQQMSEADKKRQEIQNKLQEKLDVEKKELAEAIKADREKKEEQNIALKRKRQREAEEKRDTVIVQQQEYLANFIKTETTPALYYRPSKLTPELEQRLVEQKENAQKERHLYEERREERSKDEEPETESVNEEKEQTPPAELDDTEEEAVVKE
ncbi:hypothetical protein DFQ28_008965 [Apophysomyces sp. BC1034]|nr:hypothetical protein DFQ30_008695 [Apophysomyces sp. BC1015]KAG0173877.1 hypothetical protein DFQ29_007691 [Apophysomyces sp. BC1021]KAG0185681.1 hypothetical protein DFQ28_008965 [Apophysomyces sp. BC1034]